MAFACNNTKLEQGLVVVKQIHLGKQQKNLTFFAFCFLHKISLGQE